MSKTATIKLRLTAEEKTAWETQATADGVALSELIRRRMNHPVTRADGGLVPAAPAYGWGGGVDDQNAVLAAERRIEEGVWDQINQQIDGTKLVGNAITLLADRRTAECEHGRPPYVFCPTCDAD